MAGKVEVLGDAELRQALIEMGRDSGTTQPEDWKDICLSLARAAGWDGVLYRRCDECDTEQLLPGYKCECGTPYSKLPKPSSWPW